MNPLTESEIQRNKEIDEELEAMKRDEREREDRFFIDSVVISFMEVSITAGVINRVEISPDKLADAAFEMAKIMYKKRKECMKKILDISA